MAISNETESSSAPTLAIYDAAIETIRALMPFAHRFTNTIPSLLTDTQLEPHLPVLVEIANGFDESFCRFAQLYDGGIDTNEMILAANEGRSIAFAGGSVLSNIEIAYRVANEWHGSLFSDNCRLGKALRFEPMGITDEVIRQSFGDIEDYVDSIDKSCRVDLETLMNELIAERFRAVEVIANTESKAASDAGTADDAATLRHLLKNYLTVPAFWSNGAFHLREWRENEGKAIEKESITDEYRREAFQRSAQRHRETADAHELATRKEYFIPYQNAWNLIEKICPAMLANIPLNTEHELSQVDGNAAAKLAQEIYRHIPGSPPIAATQTDTKRLIAEVVSETLRVVHPEGTRPTGHVGVEPSEQKLEAVADEKSKPSGYQCAIWKDGNTWRIEGFGESASFANLKGFADIHRILSSPRKSALLVELTGELADERLANDERSQQPVIEKNELRKLNELINENKADLDSAKADNDLAEIARIEEEQAWLIKQVKAMTNVHGEPRDLNANNKRRPRVWDRIQKAIGKLPKGEPPMPKLAEHLQLCIRCEGDSVRYLDPIGIVWKTERSAI